MKKEKMFLILICTMFSYIVHSQTSVDAIVDLSKLVKAPITLDFKYPLGYPDLKGYHDAKPFRYKNHLGCDFNKDGCGDNDLGDTIRSIGNGKVTLSSVALLNILHRTTNPNYPYVVASYFHCKELLVEYGEIVKIGQPVALVGKVLATNAHLHFEIITNTEKVAGYYGKDPDFIDPVKFIEEN